jgi:diketogulonate reductase-like aldo/keto reductase
MAAAGHGVRLGLLFGALTAAASRLPAEAPGPNVTLGTGGLALPLVGFGCAGRLGVAELREAIGAGYRLFDTAQAAEWYDEGALGEALAATGVRAFVTTKVHPRDFGARATAAAVARSLARLRAPAVDLLLLHYAQCWGSLCEGAPPPEGDWRAAWRALEVAHAAGSARALGVSNFGVAELDALWAMARVKPAVLQAHMDPFAQNRALRAWCAQHGVVFQAYSTLGTQHRVSSGNPVLGSAALAAIARARGRSVAQVVLRWALDRGVAVLPRSSDPARMRANLRLFDFALSEGERRVVDDLDGTDPDAHARGGGGGDGRGENGGLEVVFVNGVRDGFARASADASGGSGAALALAFHPEGAAGPGEPVWALGVGESLRLQSAEGHAFSAARASDPATTIWRWVVPPAGAEDGGAAREVRVVVTAQDEAAKQEL